MEQKFFYPQQRELNTENETLTEIESGDGIISDDKSILSLAETNSNPPDNEIITESHIENESSNGILATDQAICCSIEEKKKALKEELKSLQESRKFRGLLPEEEQRIKLIGFELKELAKAPKELKVTENKIEARQISANSTAYELFSRYVDFCLELQSGKRNMGREEMEAAINGKMWPEYLGKKTRFKTWLRENAEKGKAGAENAEEDHADAVK